MNTGINAEYGKRVVNAIADGTTVSFPTPFVGLLDASGKEISYPEYCRVAINVNGIEGKAIMADAVTTTVTETQTATDSSGNPTTYTETKVQSSVQNQDYIYFPENETGTTVTVAALGIFSSKSATTAPAPYLTGYLKNARNEQITVDVRPNSVPIFRIGKFKISLK